MIENKIENERRIKKLLSVYRSWQYQDIKSEKYRRRRWLKKPLRYCTVSVPRQERSLGMRDKLDNHSLALYFISWTNKGLVLNLFLFILVIVVSTVQKEMFHFVRYFSYCRTISNSCLAVIRIKISRSTWSRWGRARVATTRPITRHCATHEHRM